MPNDVISEEPLELSVQAYPAALRGAAAGLLLASGLAVLGILARALLAEPALTASAALRAFLAVSALPALAAWLVGRALRAHVRVDGNRLAVQVGGQDHDVPLAAIVDVEPWRLPLPRPGLVLRLDSGQRFALGIAAPDPSPLVARLADAGVPHAARALAHPTLVYGRVKHAAGQLGWRRLLAKFPLFAALVAGVVFNAHQQVAYGGTLGQYELEGAVPYVWSFLGYWAAVSVSLVFYATVWRWPAELVALLAARWGEPPASRVRRSVELICRIAYYAGVPALLALRFAQ